MSVKRSPGLAMLLVLSAISTAAAARSTDASVTSSAQFLSEPGNEIREEIKRFGYARISVRDAIKIAQERITGARVVDVSFDGQSDRMTYRITTYRADEIWIGLIDASTGMVVGEGNVTPVSALNCGDRIELARFRAAGIDLSDVVSIAEEYGSGSAVSAGLGAEDGKLIFLVVLVADGALKQVSLDASRDRSRSRKALRGGRGRR